MTGLPDLLTVALRPVSMIVVGAVAYKASKLVAQRHIAARIAFIGTCVLFVFELTSIRYPLLRDASAMTTLAGTGILALIFKERAVHG